MNFRMSKQPDNFRISLGCNVLELYKRFWFVSRKLLQLAKLCRGGVAASQEKVRAEVAAAGG